MPLARVDVRISSRALLRDFKSPKAAFISLSFHHRRVLFRFSAAAQASLHRPAPRTRSRATLIPLLRPLDRRKELLSHISPVSSTALILILRYLRFTSATHAFCDRSPFLCRRANFLCRRSTFLCRRVSPGEAAPKGATRRGDPTLRVRSTLRLAPTATPIRPIYRPSSVNLPSIVWLFLVRLCGHRTAVFGPTADLVWSFRQFRSPLLLTSFPSSVKRSRAVCVESRHALCSDADPTMKRDT